MQIIVRNKLTGEILPTVQQQMSYGDAQQGPAGEQAFAIDLQEAIPFDHLEFSFTDDIGQVLVQADGYVLHEPAPFWDVVHAKNIVAIDRVVTETMALTYVPAVLGAPYQPYSKTCPPPESSDNVRFTSSSGGDASVGCSSIKVGEWVGAHGVSVTITEPSDGTTNPPTTHPGPSAPDDPPWYLRNWYMDCL